MKTPVIRVLALLEAHSITGPAKVIVELARETILDGRGGSEEPQVQIGIATFLRRAGENAFTDAIHTEGIPIEVIEERGVLDPGVLPQIRELLVRLKPDIVWTHSVKSHFLLRMGGHPKGTHWIASHHGYTTTDFKTRMYNELDRWSLPGAERVITVCQKFAADLEERGIRPERIRVQHSPIRRSASPVIEIVDDLRRALKLTQDTRVILTVGRMSREKGHADLIRAFSLLQSASSEPIHLIIVGGGPELENLETLAKSLGVRERITLAGQQSDVRPYYALADLFVLPSHSEGSPNVLLEAMDKGLPVIATAVGGVPEIVTDEVSGLLVEVSKPQAMADAILRLLSNPELRLRLAASAHDVLKQHTPENYFRELRSIFEEVARG